MRRVFILFLFVFSANATASCVILLHGLARSENSMVALERALSDADFYPVNLGYPSRHHDIVTLSSKAVVPALEKCPKDGDIHFVTHSLGGILVRQYLSDNTIPRLGRVVMLGPPNSGSEVVDKLGDFPGFRFINGEAGMQLGTGELSVPNSLGAADFDLGVIAGSKSINWFLSMLIPDVDDGKVSIARTKLEGMNDHIVLPASHPFLMKNDVVIEQVIYFLRNGEFAWD